MKILTLDSYPAYNDFVREVKKNPGLFNEFTLVGGYLERTGGPWRWEGGDYLSYNFNWAAGEPNNPNGEFCLSLKINNGAVGMNDIWCTQAQRFLCSDAQDTAFFFNGQRDLKD
jgi:hypothetical protein